MSPESPPRKKLPLLKFAIGALLLLVIAALLLRGVDLKSIGEKTMEWVRAAGPGAFFLAMALLPAVGVPASPFTLTAGTAFGEQLGFGVVVALSIAAVAANIALSYFLARWVFRPLLEKLMTRLGYKLPQVESRDAMDLVIIVRITPGVPFPVQNYLLALAGVPFGKYLVGSCLIACSYTAAFVLFGDALLHGRGGMILIAVSVLAALAAGAHLVRRHYGRKKPKHENG